MSSKGETSQECHANPGQILANGTLQDKLCAFVNCKSGWKTSSRLHASNASRRKTSVIFVLSGVVSCRVVSCLYLLRRCNTCICMHVCTSSHSFCPPILPAKRANKDKRERRRRRRVS
ncbi:hypothetical protein V8C26DRAFT_403812 [Trichoderma gracile]